MEDYYRVRFSRLRVPRPASSWSVIYDRKRPPLPRPLRTVYSVSCILSGVGWVTTVAVGRGGPIQEAPWLLCLIFPMPIAMMLALGFREDERWTRPLTALLLPFAAAAIAFAEFYWVACLVVVPAVITARYLYSAPGVKDYYSFLPEIATNRVTMSDLKSANFLSLHLCVGGIATGCWLGYLVRCYP